MKRHLLILLCLLAAGPNIYAAAGTPEATVKAYFAALRKSDRSKASALTARSAKFGDKEAAAVTEEYIKLHQRPGYSPSIRQSKTIEDCAVVILYESPTDPDPAFLIMQNGDWRVFPKITRFERDDFDLPEAVRARFRQLETWYNDQVGKSPRPELEPFSEATIKDPQALAKFLDKGFDANARSPGANKETLLWWAVRFEALSSVKLLLERGARVDERSSGFKKTALFQAAYDGSMDIAKALLDAGSDPNATDNYGNNPLREAILGKKADMVALLLQRGANPNQANKDGQTMKDIAAKHGTARIQAILAGNPAP